MILGLLAAALIAFQDDRDSDPAKLPAEPEKFYRLALYEPAEKAMREVIKNQPTEANHIGLLQILLRARMFSDLSSAANQGLRIATPKQTQLLAFSHAMLAIAYWNSGNNEAAGVEIAAALQIADKEAPNAFPAIRRTLRALKGYLEWKKFESRTHVIRYPANSPLAATIQDVGARLDERFDKIRVALDVTFEGKIDVFIHNDQVQADAIVGWPLNYALPRDKAYHVLPNAPFGLEMAQVLSFYAANRSEKEKPRSSLVTMGFAVAWSQDARFEERMNSIPAEMLRRETAGVGQLPPLASLDKTAGESVESMVVAASFVRWLHLTRTAEKFIKLWAEYNDSRDPWTAVYGKTLGELEKAWRLSIK